MASRPEPHGAQPVAAEPALLLPRGVRLRLNLALPLSLGLFTIAAGSLALNVLRVRVPAVEQSSSAMLLAALLTVGLGLVAAVAGRMLAAGVRAPLNRLLSAARQTGLAAVAPADTVPDELKLLSHTVNELALLLGELRLSEEVLFTLRDPVILLGADGAVVAVNRGAGEFLGVAPEQVRGQALAEMLAQSQAKGAVSAVTGLVERGLSLWRAGAGKGGDNAEQEDAGRWLTLTEVVSWPLQDGTSAAVELRLVTGRNVGAGPRDREVPGKAVAALLLSPRGSWDDLRLRIERLNNLAALGATTAALSHELRGPLSALAARAELVMEELPPQSPKREQLARIIREVEGASQFMDHVLDVAQPRRLDWTLVDPAAVARRALELYRAQASAGGHTLTFHAEGDAPRVQGDEERLFQVFANLVRNACEAVDAGGRVAVTVRRVNDAELGDAVSVEVHNTGPPIPAALMPQLFRPFYTTKPGGTGLGLPICQYLVRAHGGTLRVRSEEGLGTVFEVLLPVARVPHA